MRRSLPRLRPSANFGWNIVGAAATQGATFAATLAIANLLGPGGLARYVVAQNTTITLANLFQGGLSFTLVNFIARYRVARPARARAIFVFARRCALALAAVAAAGLALGASPVAARAYGDATLVPFVVLSAVAIPLATLQLVQNGALGGLEAFRDLARAAAAGAAIFFAAVVGGALLGGALGAAVGLAVATALRFAVYGRILRGAFARAGVPKVPDASPVWPEIRDFALPAGLAALTITPALWLSNAALARNAGLPALGVFSAMFLLKTAASFVPMQVGLVVLPRYSALRAAGDPAAARALWPAVAACAGMSAAVGLALTAIAPFLPALFGAKFASGQALIPWLMLVSFFESTASILSVRFAGGDRMWHSFLGYSTPRDILLVGLALLWTPAHGALGLVWAHAVAFGYALVAALVLPTFGRRGAAVSSA